MFQIYYRIGNRHDLLTYNSSPCIYDAYNKYRHKKTAYNFDKFDVNMMLTCRALKNSDDITQLEKCMREAPKYRCLVKRMAIPVTNIIHNCSNKKNTISRHKIKMQIPRCTWLSQIKLNASKNISIMSLDTLYVIHKNNSPQNELTANITYVENMSFDRHMYDTMYVYYETHGIVDKPPRIIITLTLVEINPIVYFYYWIRSVNLIKTIMLPKIAAVIKNKNISIKLAGIATIIMQRHHLSNRLRDTQGDVDHEYALLNVFNYQRMYYVDMDRAHNMLRLTLIPDIRHDTSIQLTQHQVTCEFNETIDTHFINWVLYDIIMYTQRTHDRQFRATLQRVINNFII